MGKLIVKFNEVQKNAINHGFILTRIDVSIDGQRFRYKLTCNKTGISTFYKKLNEALPELSFHVPKPQASILKNHIAIILDRSGSMGPIRDETIAAFNSQIRTIREQSEKTGQETTVSLYTFANVATPAFVFADVKNLKPLTKEDYSPSGGTALFDGVGKAIDDFKAHPDNNNPNASFLLITITDGEENQSRNMRAADIVEALRQTQMTDRWTHVFQLPPGKSESFIRMFNIPRDNIQEWECTKEGVKAASEVTTSGFSNYFTARSQGKTSVQNFYNVDLSNVTNKKINQNLDDLKGNFKKYQTDSEIPIKDFFEKKMRKPYVNGSTYYQLVKTEKIQSKKKLLIMERGKDSIWGGEEARTLVGLPVEQEIKVNPTNLGKYEVFVQSTSVNRKLPRGSIVLIDVTKTKNDMPTWEDTSAKKK